MKTMKTLGNAVEMGSARAFRAVFRALVEHKDSVHIFQRLLKGLLLTPTSEGAGRNTRGRVRPPLSAESLALGRGVLALMACCAAALLLKSELRAQTFTTLYSFTEGGSTPRGCFTNADGAQPEAGLILSGNTLYGTAYYGGSGVSDLYPDCGGYGTVFALRTNGIDFTTLHNFTYGDDGEYPSGQLFLSGDTLYGTSFGGGVCLKHR